MRNQSLVPNLRRLQVAQYRHDQKAHQDILALPVQRRLTHFTLHFSKYVGALARAHRAQDATTKCRVITDSCVIALAAANAMNVDLRRCIESTKKIAAPSSHRFEDLLLDYAEVVGEMCKACEALDHLEDFQYRSTLERGVVLLIPIVGRLADLESINLPQHVRERWRAIEQKPVVYKDDGEDSEFTLAA